MRTVVILGCLLCTAVVAHALTLQKYLTLRQSRDHAEQTLLHAYLVGLGEGILWTEIHVRTTYGIKLYCPPEARVFTEKDYRAILDAKISRLTAAQVIQDLHEQDLLGMLLLAGLIETFPCATR